MSGGIYLIQNDDRLVEMKEQAYETEEQLQELLEKYPNLLAGDRIDRGTARQWLTVYREIDLPIDEDGDGRWSLEHLFVDQNAIPTLVSVKHSDDTASRRQVIGQLLEYAANAMVAWPLEFIVSQFESNCRHADRDPEQVFAEFLGDEADEERFWQQVKTNLQASKIRLIFVSDEISSQLQQVVEFLNEQMSPAEVLALEIKQFVGEGELKTLVPRSIGQTAGARKRKASATRERRKWDPVSFFQEFQARHSSEEAAKARWIYDWAISKAPNVMVHWGTGDTYGGFSAEVKPKNLLPMTLFTVAIDGGLWIDSREYAKQPPFNEQQEWLELRSQLSSIGLALPLNLTEGRQPNCLLSTVNDKTALDKVLDTFERILQKILASEQRGSQD
ncbi:hypothetical protein [Geitlerinema sp. PCC 9228]|jgi:hypothetical protein|uniref:hypothetical protein n=1 Tax=Geitlerinema sp. PCC 9228 TaxID=111611 RepID=UPI0008F9B25E|nr:hypothetical protein [Geitlerinema sp. PCC 9228]